MRTVFMGTPEFALPVIEGLLTGDYQLVGVYTRPDQPAGRGRQPAPPPVKTYALSRGLPVFQPRSLRREEAVRELASLQPEVIVVAAYGRILPPEALAVPPRGVLNIHPSLLPKYRGPSPVITALLDGESVTGVTVMLLDEGMDTGNILAQRQTAILPHETAGELTHRLFRLGAELLLEVLPKWTAGELKPVPQEEAMATITRLYTKEDGDMDWSLPAAVLERRLRALQPWPGCYTRWEGKLLKVLDGAAAGEVSTAPPGQVVALPRGSAFALAVAAGQGLLGLAEVQLEGRKAQAAEEFLRGYPRFVGVKLPS
ncbi:MAG: methionyl-tRNA formyltransferase [Dehalococcoidia bacterium]|nr:methionyl-tRNA formyltransferase [Dehalococcoidia bacterium]